MKKVLYLIIASLLVMGLVLAGCPSGNGNGDEDQTVTIKPIGGVTAPATGNTPVTTISETAQFTGAVAWNPAHTTFEAETVYTATITLTAKSGYTFTGVTANFFTVSGATATNAAGSGEVEAVFPATAAAPAPKIKIAIAGPMDYIQGTHMRWGARLARDEINAGTKINVDGTLYEIELIEVDTDEIDNPGEAGDKVKFALTVEGADFVVGGFRTEAVQDMLDAAAESQKIMYICGAATAALLANTVVADYDTYKYIFRGTPINDYFLLNNTLIMLGMVGEGIKGALTAQGAAVTAPRVAIFAEELLWADPIVAGVQQLIAGLGYELTYTARVPDDASATVVAAQLSAIEDAQTHIIFTILSGPVGLTYGTQMGVLEIPAMSVGINVESQDPMYWTNTDGGASHQITLTTLAPNVRQTAKTGPFIEKFMALSGGVFPAYTSASYDIIYNLKEAIEAVGLDTDDLIAYLENPANAFVGTSGISNAYPPGLPFPFLRHDLMYGPEWVTGIGAQWLDGEIVGVWPKTEFGALANAICLFKPTIDWTGFEYEGTQMFAVAPWMIGSWLAFTP